MARRHSESFQQGHATCRMDSAPAPRPRRPIMSRRGFASLAVTVLLAATGTAAEPLKVGTFQVDATPPLGSPLCDALCLPAKEIVDRLSARGVVLVTDERPIVLCAIDWVGIGNGGYDAWRQALAEAAGTTESRV